MKTQITDFRFNFVGHGHYMITYTSPKTGVQYNKLVTDMQWVDEFKNTETQDHTQKRLNEFKKYLKN